MGYVSAGPNGVVRRAKSARQPCAWCMLEEILPFLFPAVLASIAFEVFSLGLRTTALLWITTENEISKWCLFLHSMLAKLCDRTTPYKGRKIILSCAARPVIASSPGCLKLVVQSLLSVSRLNFRMRPALWSHLVFEATTIRVLCINHHFTRKTLHAVSRTDDNP